MVSQAILPQLQRALGLHQAGRNVEAWLILAPLRAAIDNNSQGLRLYALVAGETGRTDEVISALERIAALEGSPPMILGAIADTYGKAGRYREAYDQWTKLVAAKPDLLDAHVNRAIAAGSAGMFEEALRASEEGLKRSPRDARLLSTKAQALKNTGTIEDALEAYRVAVAADPNGALTRHNQGVALRAACRFDEACAAFAEAERLGMKGPQFDANWAAAELEAGHVERAAELYRKALAEDPRHQESQLALTRLQIEYLAADDPFAHYEAVTRSSGFAVLDCANWINALMRHNRPDEAAKVAAEALARNPDHPMFRTMGPFFRGMTGHPGPSLDKLEEQAVRSPDDTYLADAIQVLSIRAGRWERAEELLQQQLARDPENQIVWAKLSVVWRMLDDPREHWLCDYDQFVMVTEVPSIGGLNSAEYADVVAATLDPLHQTLHAPGDQTLRGGTQSSGALFSRPEKEIQEFRQAILQAASERVALLPDDPTHPFLRRKSRNLATIGSWSVRLQSEGHHVNHMHHEGWMSSAYYARMPSLSDKARDRHEGWIQFGVPSENFGVELSPRRIVEPQEGRLVLFPSYIWHGTIPFQTGDRLTAAFDFQPV